MTARALADRWRGKRVIVLGDALLDGWLTGSAAKLCREAPAPVVEISNVEYACGGAANTAVNLAALGAAPTLVGIVGQDEAGTLLRERIAAAGVRDRLVTVRGRRTVTKRRLVADGRIVARIDDGDTGPAPAAAVRELCLRLARTTAPIVVCDYATGALTGEIIDWLARRRQRVPLLVVDAHHPARWRSTRPSVVTPNYAETCDLLREAPTAWPSGDPACDPNGPAAHDTDPASLGTDPAAHDADPARLGTDPAADDADPVRFVADRAARILAVTGARNAAVTLDVHGSVLLGDGRMLHRTHAAPAPSSQTAGAGDAYTAALMLALLAGAPGPLAADLGQRAADVATGRRGTAVCTVADLLAEPPPHTEPAGSRSPAAGTARPARQVRPASAALTAR